MDKTKVGLAVGLFLAIVHVIWALIVAIIPNALQSFLDWIFNIHFLEPVWKLTTFNFANAVFLVIVTFIWGFILGWIFAWVHELCCKKKK